MFAKETVLVLGAGASWHYGYPLGEELIDKIISYVKENSDSEGEAQRISQSLLFRDPLSIDSFLNFWSEHENFAIEGKKLITKILLACENDASFQRGYKIHKYNSDKKETEQFELGNWYKFLANSLIAGVRDNYEYLVTEPLKLSVITFNYDVSLECYLHTRFKKIPNLSPEQTNTFLEKIDNSINHVYGQLGRFDWQKNSDRKDSYGFINEKLPVFLVGREGSYKEFTDIKSKNEREEKCLALSSKILLMGQRSNQDYNAHKEILNKAEHIFFLGFGFNQDNISALDLNNSCKNAGRIYYTNKDDSMLINEIVYDLFPGHSKDKRSKRLICSTKDVYSALKYDFSLI